MGRNRATGKDRQRDITKEYEKEFKKFKKEFYGALIFINDCVGYDHTIDEKKVQTFFVSDMDLRGKAQVMKFGGISEIVGLDYNGKIYQPEDSCEDKSQAGLRLVNPIGVAKRFEKDLKTEKISEISMTIYDGFEFTKDKPPVGSQTSVTFKGFKQIMSLLKSVDGEKKTYNGEDSLSLDLESIAEIEELRCDGLKIDESKYKLDNFRGSVIHPVYRGSPIEYNLFNKVNILDKSDFKQGSELSVSYKGYEKENVVCYFCKDYKTNIDESGNVPLNLSLYVNIQNVQVGDDSYDNIKDIKKIFEFKDGQGMLLRPKSVDDIDEKVELIAEQTYKTLSVKELGYYPVGTPVTITYFGFMDDSYVMKKNQRIQS